jgi:hypothetical protein
MKHHNRCGCLDVHQSELHRQGLSFLIEARLQVDWQECDDCVAGVTAQRTTDRDEQYGNWTFKKVEACLATPC